MRILRWMKRPLPRSIGLVAVLVLHGLLHLPAPPTGRGCLPFPLVHED
jgi:hypothetical protein